MSGEVGGEGVALGSAEGGDVAGEGKGGGDDGLELAAG